MGSSRGMVSDEKAGRSFLFIVEDWRDEMTLPSIMTILLTMASYRGKKYTVEFRTVCHEYMITQVTRSSRTKLLINGLGPHNAVPRSKLARISAVYLSK